MIVRQYNRWRISVIVDAAALPWKVYDVFYVKDEKKENTIEKLVNNGKLLTTYERAISKKFINLVNATTAAMAASNQHLQQAASVTS